MGLHLYIPEKHLQSSKKGKVVLIFSLDTERDFDQKKKKIQVIRKLFLKLTVYL